MLHSKILLQGWTSLQLWVWNKYLRDKHHWLWKHQSNIIGNCKSGKSNFENRDWNKGYCSEWKVSIYFWWLKGEFFGVCSVIFEKILKWKTLNNCRNAVFEKAFRQWQADIVKLDDNSGEWVSWQTDPLWCSWELFSSKIHEKLRIHFL
jgi:hypothetical protein